MWLRILGQTRMTGPNIPTLIGLLNAPDDHIQRWTRAAVAWTLARHRSVLTTTAYAATWLENNPLVVAATTTAQAAQLDKDFGARFALLPDLCESWLLAAHARDRSASLETLSWDAALERAWKRHCDLYDPENNGPGREATHFWASLAADLESDFRRAVAAIDPAWGWDDPIDPAHDSDATSGPFPWPTDN